MNGNGQFSESKWGSIIKHMARNIGKQPDWNSLEIILRPGEHVGSISVFDININLH